jgi:hypothetical protein
MPADYGLSAGHIADTLLSFGVADNVFSMARPISTIEQEIRSLSASDKEGLLRVLLEELDGPPDLEAEAVWLEEVHKRSRELDAGGVECIPANEVFETIDSSLKK